MAVVVTAASVQDREGALWLLNQLPGGCKKLRKIWVYGGYGGRLLLRSCLFSMSCIFSVSNTMMSSGI